MNPNRREFVWSSLALSAARALWDPSAWLAPQAAGAAAPVALDSRVLLVIQMTGGNDGLNTVVPLDDDLYHRARPRLRVAKGSAVRLTNGLGLHPAMESLRPMWDRGELAVATNIGYPNHDRSHFRSMEIWHTARVEAGAPPIGWLGRGADALGIRDGAAPVLHVGSTEQPLSLVGERIVCPSMVDAERAALRSHTNKTEQGRLLDELCDAPRGAQAAWIASEAKIAYAFAARLEAAAGNFRPAVPYPNTTFARKLRTVAHLLEAGLPRASTRSRSTASTPTPTKGTRTRRSCASSPRRSPPSTATSRRAAAAERWYRSASASSAGASARTPPAAPTTALRPRLLLGSG